MTPHKAEPRATRARNERGACRAGRAESAVVYGTEKKGTGSTVIGVLSRRIVPPWQALCRSAFTTSTPESDWGELTLAGLGGRTAGWPKAVGSPSFAATTQSPAR